MRPSAIAQKMPPVTNTAMTSSDHNIPMNHFLIMPTKVRKKVKSRK